jgi:hypothetical protein
MGYQGVWTARRDQTKDKQIKYYLKIKKKKFRKWMHCIITIETASVHHDEVGEAQ